MKKWYNNGIQNLLLNDNECIPNGFVLGRLKFTQTHNEKISIARKGKFYINNGAISKCVSSKDFEQYYNDGNWVRGRILSKKGIEAISNSKKNFFKNNPDWKPNNMWTKGHEPWNKGIPMKESSKHKLSITKLGSSLSNEAKILKMQHETQTRINNSGDLKTSYKHACEKSKITRKIHEQNDALYLKKIKEKFKSTSLKRYGYETPMLNPDIQEKRRQTCLEKYGVESPMQTKEIQQKVYDSKKRNKSFPKSKEEDKLYEYLLTLFPISDIYRQYQDDRYKNDKCKFNCDFYIKSLDLFIELNAFWTHGGRLYTGSPKDLVQLNHWIDKSKNSKMYKSAIETWTERDVEKFQCAKNNKLNYLTLYKMEEIYDYFS